MQVCLTASSPWHRHNLPTKLSTSILSLATMLTLLLSPNELSSIHRVIRHQCNFYQMTQYILNAMKNYEKNQKNQKKTSMTTKKKMISKSLNLSLKNSKTNLSNIFCMASIELIYLMVFLFPSNHQNRYRHRTFCHCSIAWNGVYI